MRRLRQLFPNVFRAQLGRVAVWAGVRAALAVTIPFALATLLGLPEVGWTGLTGLLVSLSDRGGSYAGRARVMGSVTLLGALVGGLAALVGDHLLSTAILLFMGVIVACLARCYGETAGGVGDRLAIIFVASMGLPAVELGVATSRAGALLLGGGWAMLQALVLWPFHPYLPARKAVAALYRALADAANDMARLVREEAPQEVWDRTAARYKFFGPALEEARDMLASIRVGRFDEPRRGEHLLVFVELGDRVAATLRAIADAMEANSRVEQGVREEVAEACERYAVTARPLSRVIRDPDRPAPHLPAREPRDVALPGSLRALLDRLRSYTDAELATAAALQRKHPVAEERRHLVKPPPDRRAPLLEPIRANLNARSVLLRHALRAGVVATVSLVVTRALGLGQVYWVVLSTIGILQPFSAMTVKRARQRIVGTLVGGTLAAVLATTIHTWSTLLMTVGALTAVSVALLPLNFGVFQVFLTPDFLLLTTLSVGDWTVAGHRALGVFIASALALVGTWLLWPSRASHRFSDAAADVLRKDGRYFQLVAEGRGGTEPELTAARRDVRLAQADAEASFNSLMAEYKGRPQELEAAMALVTYARRFASSVQTLGEQPPAVDGSEPLENVAEKASGALHQMSDALQNGHRPPPIETLATGRVTDDPISGVLAVRVPRQLEILHGAVERFTAGAPAGTRAEAAHG